MFTSPPRAAVAEREWTTLVRRIAAGDQSALQALYKRAHMLVFTLCVRITGSRETGEEVALDVFHGVWKRAASYDPAGGPVLGWVMNQARSKAIDRLRFEQRAKRGSEHGVDPLSGAEEGERRDWLELREEAQLLRNAVAALDERERQAIETAYFEQLTYAETALRLNQPIGTVKTRIRTALEKLRSALDERRSNA